VLTELRQRGLQDIYIACMDGLKGLPEAVTAIFPRTLTQLCIVQIMSAGAVIASLFERTYNGRFPLLRLRGG
jgi:transposase-like protein